MSIRNAALIVAALTVSALANAQGKPAVPTATATAGAAAMKPGLWEIKSAHDALDAKSKRTVTSRLCYSGSDVATPSKIVPPARGFGMICETRDVKSAAADVTWKVACKGKDGSLAGAGSMTPAADSYSAQVQFQYKTGAKISKLEEKIVGRWIGTCS